MEEVVVTTEIAAPAEVVYELVSDLPRMGEWSPECTHVVWVGDDGGARVGAQFTGSNRKGWRRWSTTGRILAADPGRELSFEITSVFGLPVARWSYRMEQAGNGCRIDEAVLDRRGAFMRVLGLLATGVWDRAERNRETMTVTLAQLKRAAEAKTRAA